MVSFSEKEQGSNFQILSYRQDFNTSYLHAKEILDCLNTVSKQGILDFTANFYLIDGFTTTTFASLEEQLNNLKDNSKNILLNKSHLTRDVVPYLLLPIQGIASIPFLKDNYNMILKTLEEDSLFVEPQFHKEISIAIENKKKKYFPIKKLNLHQKKATSVLSEKEYSVLQLLLDGCTNKEIAHKMFFAPSTVSTMISKILKKMHVPDRTNAVITAIKAGWVEGDR